MRRILYVAPTEIRRSGIAEYAVAFSSALARVPALRLDSVTDLLGPQLSPSRDMGLSEAAALARWAVASGALAPYHVVHLEVGTELYPEFFFTYEIAKRLPGIRLVLTVHDAPYTVKNLQPFWDLGPRTSTPFRLIRKALNLTIGNWYERALARRTAVTLVLSQRARQSLEAHSWPRRIVVIPHVAPRGETIALLEPWDGNTPLRVLFFGFLYRPKGVHHLIDAIAELAQDRNLRSHIRLSICGGAATGDVRGDYRVQLEQLVAERDLGDIVRFEGFVANERVQEVMCEHQVIVLPYLAAKELSTSGPLVRAMSYGLVPIVTPVRAIAEFIDDGENGYVVPVGNPHAIAERLRTLLMSPALVAHLARQAQASIVATHTWNAIAERMVEVYDSIL